MEQVFIFHEIRVAERVLKILCHCLLWDLRVMLRFSMNWFSQNGCNDGQDRLQEEIKCKFSLPVDETVNNMLLEFSIQKL